MNEIGAEVRVEEIRRIGMGREERREMVVVKLGNEKEKQSIMENKKKLRGKDIWIHEDWTWKERKIK